MQTRAAIHIAHGAPMVVDEITLPDPGPTQVLIKQFATGVCHSQLHELHNPTPRMPLILGHESTGVVLATGGAVTHVRAGDHVMVTWVQRAAAEGAPPPVPAQLSYQGKPIGFGAPALSGVFTWAESVLIDEKYVVTLDADVATDVTAIIGCAVMTGCGAAINSAKVRPNEAVAVIGVGGVGLCIIQAAANLSAYPIIAVDLTEEKLAFARRFGATHGVNASREDAVARIRELTGGGADYAFDAIGVKATMEQALQAARPGVTGLRDGGMAVLVGVPHGPQAEPAMNLIFGGKTYRGAPGGSCRPERDFPLFVRWFRDGKLPLDQLVTRRYRLEEINEACAALEQGDIAGRAIITFE